MNQNLVASLHEKFAGIEEILKDIADSQAKADFASRRERAVYQKEIAEMRRLQFKTQRQLDHITEVIRLTLFQNEKFEQANDAGRRKRQK